MKRPENVPQLTADQIIAIVDEVLDMSIDNFAEGEYPYVLKGDEEKGIEDYLTDQDKELFELKTALIEERKALPGYSDAKLRDEHYKNLENRIYAIPWIGDVKVQRVLEKVGIGPRERVENVGGEGQGNTRYVTQYFPWHNVYIQTDGYYSSYDGTEWGENGYGDEVFKTLRVVTVYATLPDTKKDVLENLEKLTEYSKQFK